MNGVIDLILAEIIISGLPGTLVWALGLLVGIDLLFGGAIAHRHGVGSAQGGGQKLKSVYQLAPGRLGRWFCPCHGSKYDLAGRVFRGVPAPYNLPVPPYRFVTDKIIRIGENPAGQRFELDLIIQL